MSFTAQIFAKLTDAQWQYVCVCVCVCVEIF